jgi:hypothetical protein
MGITEVTEAEAAPAALYNRLKMGTMRNALRETRVWDAYKSLAAYPDYYYWRLRGSPMRHVPHLVKQRALHEHAQRYGLRAMVETGTNLGQMIASMLPVMDEIWSIEMGDWSYQRACRRFEGNPKVHLVQGDSGVKMYEVAPHIKQACLYWLDAHEFDRLTPIREELDAIAANLPEGSAILIDDSKWFDGRNQYPTMEWMREFVKTQLKGYRVEDSMHIIRLLPG